MDENGSAAMLAAKRSAGVAPEVNLRIPLCTGKEACKQARGCTATFKPGQTSAEVQIRGNSDPTKRTDVLQKLKINKNISMSKKHSSCLIYQVLNYWF